MIDYPAFMLVAAVATVGVLHTMVPDHWVPITVLARQRGWTRAETARTAFQAGCGHVTTTLLLGLVVWLAGAAAAQRFGHLVDAAASAALVAFGGWIALSAWRDLSCGFAHAHGHDHSHPGLLGFLGNAPRHDGGMSWHGPEQQQFATDGAPLVVSIFEDGVPPRFRLSGPPVDAMQLETVRPYGERQKFTLAERGTYWESIEAIPEPHGFEVTVTCFRDGRASTYRTQFIEHGHHHTHDVDPDAHTHAPGPFGDPLYTPMDGELLVCARHTHAHRHHGSATHSHWHEHDTLDSHAMAATTDTVPPSHRHKHKTTARTALLLILGSSPMVEGIPAFFAASHYGVWLIMVMALVFAASTIATYMALCLVSTAGLRRVRLGPFERYGEVISGAFVMVVGAVFWFWPLI
jgi:nickel/cobalt transporter (NicO) family protein